MADHAFPRVAQQTCSVITCATRVTWACRRRTWKRSCEAWRQHTSHACIVQPGAPAGRACARISRQRGSWGSKSTILFSSCTVSAKLRSAATRELMNAPTGTDRRLLHICSTLQQAHQPSTGPPHQPAYACRAAACSSAIALEGSAGWVAAALPEVAAVAPAGAARLPASRTAPRHVKTSRRVLLVVQESWAPSILLAARAAAGQRNTVGTAAALRVSQNARHLPCCCRCGWSAVRISIGSVHVRTCFLTALGALRHSPFKFDQPEKPETQHRTGGRRAARQAVSTGSASGVGRAWGHCQIFRKRAARARAAPMGAVQLRRQPRRRARPQVRIATGRSRAPLLAHCHETTRRQPIVPWGVGRSIAAITPAARAVGLHN